MKQHSKTPALAVLVLLAGCTVGGTQGYLISGEKVSNVNADGTCEPEKVFGLKSMETGAIAGSATLITTDDTIRVEYRLDEGWTWSGKPQTVIAPLPYDHDPIWTNITVPGQDVTIVEVPAADLALTCGGNFKLWLLSFALDPDGLKHHISIAFTDGPSTSYEWNTPVLCCEPADEGCTLTPGFWMTHPEAWPEGFSLTYGGTTYDADALMAILWTPAKGDASVILARHLIAAELNLANGASPAADLQAARDWMDANTSTLPAEISPRTAKGRAATKLADGLAGYNEGATGPGHCGD